MACIKDLRNCRADESLGYCCSGVCLQQVGEQLGYCQLTPTASSPPKIPNTTASTCLVGGTRCKSDGTLGTCCSINCVQFAHQEFGTCSHAPPPTNIPERCLKEGEDCKADSSLGICCGSKSVCLVIAPHVIGLCEPISSTTATKISETSAGNTWIIYTCVTVVVAISLLAGFIWLYRRQRKLEEGLSEREANHFFNGDPDSVSLVSGLSQESVDNRPYDKHLEIHEPDFTIDWENPLGQGCYGVVLKGRIRNVVNVAVKTSRSSSAGSSSKSYLQALLCEIKVLQYLGKHENIVSMVGCHTSKLRNGKVYLFLEYCPMGSLEKYLRTNKHTFLQHQQGKNTYINVPMPSNANNNTTSPICNPNECEISLNDLSTWAMQITKAMMYLEEKKVIHADLATRNILLLRKDCVKLTDFGLSRRLYEYGNYVKQKQEPLPWRWMALESLQQLTFSHQSDVWSLGITIWEIYSLGDVPYPGLSWNADFVSSLESNLRPPKPTVASTKLYELMLDCWRPIPNTRPTFHEIFTRLYEIHQLEYSAEESAIYVPLF